jgi:hypothetical protein
MLGRSSHLLLNNKGTPDEVKDKGRRVNSNVGSGAFNSDPSVSQWFYSNKRFDRVVHKQFVMKRRQDSNFFEKFTYLYIHPLLKKGKDHQLDINDFAEIEYPLIVYILIN